MIAFKIVNVLNEYVLGKAHPMIVFVMSTKALRNELLIG